VFFQLISGWTTVLLADHPLRVISATCGCGARPVIACICQAAARDGPPERLPQALLLQAFYTVRSERQLMEQLRWFIRLSGDDLVSHPTVFCKNRDRLLDGDIARNFMLRSNCHT
jgi:hypothetical protein